MKTQDLTNRPMPSRIGSEQHCELGPRRKLRVLIVYENTGGGHNRVARILRETVEKVLSADVLFLAGNEVLGSKSGEWLIRLWNFVMQKNWMRIASFLDTVFTKMLALPLFEVSQASAFYARLGALAPEMIISTADPFNKGLGTYAAENGIPFVLFITQNSVNADTVNPNAVHLCYFRETIDAVQDFDLSTTFFSCKLGPSTTPAQKVVYLLRRYGDILRHGTRAIYRPAGARTRPRNEAACVAVGPLCEAKHFAPVDELAVKRRLGLEDGFATVVIASGSLGGGFVTRAVEVLCSSAAAPLNVIAVCGKDEQAHARIQKSRRSRPGVNLVSLPFVEDLNEIIAASDCVVMRPSAGIMHESLVRGKPLVACDRVTGADKGGPLLIRKHGLGEVFGPWKQLPAALDKVLGNRGAYTTNIATFLAGYPRTYDGMAQIIARVIREAAGVSAGAARTLDHDVSKTE